MFNSILIAQNKAETLNTKHKFTVRLILGTAHSLRYRIV